MVLLLWTASAVRRCTTGIETAGEKQSDFTMVMGQKKFLRQRFDF